MRIGWCASLLVALALVTGCAGAPPASGGSKGSDAPAAPSAQLETAGSFAIALAAADGDALAKLIPQDLAAEHSAEIASINGVSVDGVRPSRSWNGSVLVLGAGGQEFKMMARSATQVTASRSRGSMTLDLAQSGSRWLVTKVNGQPSVCNVLLLSPAGIACQKNMEAIFGANELAKMSEAGVVTVEQLAPTYLAKVPRCPSGGTYTLDAEKFVICTVHGMRWMDW